jgi:hypothetical protein
LKENLMFYIRGHVRQAKSLIKSLPRLYEEHGWRTSHARRSNIVTVVLRKVIANSVHSSRLAGDAL